MAEIATFSIAPGESVTAFELSLLEQTYYPGQVTRGVDALDYVFINGFVDVGDLPCRTAITNDVATRATPMLQDFETAAFNLPGFSRRLDFSGFWHVPHRLKRWARTRLFPAQTGNAPFQVTTCGGVHIWVDGQHISAFEPYRRNVGSTIDVTLPLQKEGSEVVFLIEDMAERDTNFYVELIWQGAEPLVAGVQSTADPAAISTLMELASSVRPSKIVFDGTAPLRLICDQHAPVDVAVTATVGQSVHLSHKPPLFSARATLQKGKTEIELGQLDGLMDAYHPLSLSFAVGEAQVDRNIGFALLRQGQAGQHPTDLTARKKKALGLAAQTGQARMGRVLALLGSGAPLDAAALDALTDTLDGIEARRDCSDFVMVPLLWAYRAYAPDFPADLRDRTRSAILNYRYWVDEPGNDTMWFWSENHVLCFHVSAYIAGDIFPDETFKNAGRSGAEMRARAEGQMRRWYDSVEAHGLAEWNSAAYYPIDFIGLFAMFQWGTGDMKSRASRILDQLFTMIALHTSGGVSAGTMGRAYDKELRAGPLSELAPFATVAFGTGWLNDGVAALPEFCLSDYQPPDGLQNIAFPATGTAIRAHYVQGYGAAARLALYKTAQVQLSASVDTPAGGTGHQQHLLDVQMASAPFARIWINHPGEDDPWGSNRPSYWAGNGVLPQIGTAGNRALFLSTLDRDARLPFTHAYAPLSAFDAVERGQDWMVLRSGQGVAILKATGLIMTQTTGPGADLEHRVLGLVTGWAIVAGDVTGSLDPLCQRAEAMRLTLSGGDLSLQDPADASLRLANGRGLFIAGKHQPFPTTETIPQIATSAVAPCLSETFV